MGSAGEQHLREELSREKANARYWQRVAQDGRVPPEVWVIFNPVTESPWGAYESEETARFAWKTAPGGCYPPSPVLVLPDE